MSKNNSLSGSYDNQVAAFLVKFCEEGKDYQESLQALYAAYSRCRAPLVHSTSFYHRSMSASSFSKRLIQAGFAWQYVANKVRNQDDVMFLGVRLTPTIHVEVSCDASQAIGAVETMSDEMAEFFNAYLYPEHFDGDTQALQRWDDGVPVSEIDYSMKSVPVLPLTHIEIEGNLYERRLIATVRAIKGFVDERTGLKKEGIVTFHNAEMKHKFVTAADFERIRAQLG